MITGRVAAEAAMLTAAAVLLLYLACPQSPW